MKSDLIFEVYRGNYKKVLSQSFDRPKFKMKTTEVVAIVAALAFSGRISEATQVYKTYSEKISKESLVISRFFLGISLFRQTQSSYGRQLLMENLRYKTKNPELLFFTYQGLAFIRYFLGQMQSCELLVEKALQASIEADLFYGRILSLDMSGHIFVSKGDIHKGLDRLNQAIKLCQTLGHTSLKSSLQISLATYRAQYGIDPQKSREDLVKLLEAKNFQDSYSQAYLLLELARQCTRNGEFAEADKQLELALQYIYRNGYRRQQVLLNLRLAELEYQKGFSSKALTYISVLKSPEYKLHLEVDLQAALLGLEQKIIRSLNYSEAKKNPPKQKTSAEDPIALLKQSLQSSKRPEVELIKKCEDLNCLSFLVDYFKLERGKKYLILNIYPEKGLIYSPSGLEVIHIGRSQQQLKILSEISKNSLDKEELVKRVWSYEYDPLRHDPMLFSALQALRRSLGQHADWLLRTDEGYCLNPEVRLIDVTPETKAPTERTEFKKQSLNHGLVLELNFRQIHFLQSNNFNNDGIDITKYKQLFNISKITATRDLSELHKKGYVLRTGKGRATRYLPPET